jgi:hypothetical protein
MVRLLFLFAAACSAPQARNTSSSVPCGKVAAHIVDILDPATRDQWIQEMRDDGMFPDGADADQVLEKFLTRGCQEYAWEDDMRRCLLTKTTWDAAEACQKQAWWHAKE